jgi:alkylation response protein AidB-like acyl-CoA dehydrogenase
VNLLPTSDEQEITDLVAGLLKEKAPIETVRAYVPGQGESPAWREFVEMGLFGLTIDEQHGGAGLGIPELTLLFHEFGRQLTPGPLIGTILTARTAQRVGDLELLEQTIAGDLVVAIGFPEVSGGANVGEEFGGRILIVDASSAEFCLVVTEHSTALVRTSELRVNALQSPDPGAVIGNVALDGAAVLLKESSSENWWLGSLLVTAMQVGIAEATCQRAVSYAKVREQFGQPIGGFQAVKHRCAEMAVRAEVAHFQTLYAALALSQRDADAELHVASARVLSSTASHENSADNIVIHGAMGFSDETDAHLFARRAATLDIMLETPRWYLESVAAAEHFMS